MRATVLLAVVALPVAVFASELGSKERPVRAFMPAGEREYIMRLRCPSGREPLFERVGSSGSGPYGNIVDGYKLKCGDVESMLYIDMYHQSHREQETIPGFTLLAEIPAKVATGCPPAVHGHAPGSYVFRPLEVMRNPVPERDVRAKVRIGTRGRAYAKFTIDENGSVVTKTIDVVYLSEESLRVPTVEHLSRLKYAPALHHEGCAVPFAAELGVDYE
jgi:hypothetical protein